MIEFSAFMSAVRPKDRTDQYVILSALYALNAHSKPITAREVGETLKLHLGAKTPKNIPASLRKYTAYVSPKHKGPPLQWELTPMGVEHLRAITGLALKDAQQGDFASDIGIVCALQFPELEAVINALGGPSRWREVGDARLAHVYRETTALSADGKELKVVATTSTSMGLTAAAIATSQLVHHFRPRIVAMIGIAAGTRSGNKQFGDVLVADPSVDYNSGKVVMQNGIREFLPDPYPIGLNPRLRTLLQKYRGSNSIFETIRSRWQRNKPLSQNHLYVGPLGAADQVIDDPTRIIEIQRNWRRLIGVEMETYGVYRAVQESPEPRPRFISFKAVCDFAAEKTDDWQEYAAFVAAEFAIEFFKHEWAALWPSN